MGYGLLDIANQSRREALQGISDADRRRTEIEASNKQLAAQQKAQKKQNISTGIGTGATIGATVGSAVPVVGTAVG
ncbi:bacteriocin, partial [Escherichia coli]|nr:bacteriocin [Escherichia coli]EEV9647064.1 bacteriocin [Escherichia coli]EEV9756085.1 bacteriocin [Escherichia coli]EEY9381861.1 bacteriocin [Escherichia coli]EFA2186688.1 bacteriocin [Escherichia coli]